jgi:hypothetical protein
MNELMRLKLKCLDREIEQLAHRTAELVVTLLTTVDESEGRMDRHEPRRSAQR